MLRATVPGPPVGVLGVGRDGPDDEFGQRDTQDVGEPVDICTIDVSFISLTMVIPPLLNILRPGGTLIALIKPQFEVGKGEVGKGGVVKDEGKHKEVVNKITSFLQGLNFKILGIIPSPILGADGNKEFLAGGILLQE